ncbi:XdhC family protein [Arenibacterium halophilum]|uniref:XdhC family protein n=1 Tax=Arenibacterium halophilum TaxID=2583821 RepID=A0ABY2XCR6_9RHOB|nr:XdhC family protein [Arenibacterium halophilum]TMV14759.1 XdhC family protein [Arenibacterium halophilum]
MDLHDTIPETALAWHRAGRGAALATVVETWGSAPRRVGAMLAVAGDGDMAGSVSGGCVEGAVVAEALDAIDSGRSTILTFGVSDDDAFAVGLACGGTIRVMVQPIGTGLPVDELDRICTARAQRHPIAQVVDTTAWTTRTAEAGDFPDRFRADRSGFEDDGATFFSIHNPPLRLVVVGAVHIAQALVPMARILGYDAVVIDPREAFATPARFPETRLLHDWPDDAVATVGLDSRCAVVLLTHDPKLDDPALLAALRANVFYIGALGSTRTHAKRIERLEAEGIAPADIARIHGPVGLNIGAASPAEIAVSILGQMTEVLRKGTE